MKIKGKAAAIEVGASGENSHFSRRVVEIHANDSELAGSHAAVTKASDHLVRSVPGNFEIAQTICEHYFRFTGAAGLTEHRDLQRAIRREPHDASIVKLKFCATVFTRGYDCSFEQGSIRQCRVGNNLLALRELHTAINEAEPSRAHVWMRLLWRIGIGILSVKRDCRNQNENQRSEAGDRPESETSLS